jgi:hypothetical protein
VRIPVVRLVAERHQLVVAPCVFAIAFPGMECLIANVGCDLKLLFVGERCG